MKKVYPVLLLSACFFLPFFVQAQKATIFSDSSRITRLPTATLFREDSLPHPGKDRRAFFRTFLPVRNDDELRLISTKKDERGEVHEFFEQYYKGVRVIDAHYMLHMRDSGLQSMNGNFQPIKEMSVVAAINVREALFSALRGIGATTYLWQVPEEEKLLQENTGVKDTTYYPKGSLVITSNSLPGESASKLAYRFIIHAQKPYDVWLVYVSAQTGKLLYKESQIMTTNSPGTGDTRYSGNQAFVTDTYTGGFRLRETRGSSNVAIETYNMRNAGNVYSSAPDFSDNDNSWTAAEFNNANKDNAALDAHWGTEKVFDYFNQKFSRNSWNNAGGALRGYVNADLLAINVAYGNNDNAFWDGSRMTYGRGTNWDAVTSIDVLAHEIGHGVTGSSVSGGGIGTSGEAGALNEGLSDIWGACVKHWAAPAKNTWLMASDITAGVGIRSMSNPALFGQPTIYGQAGVWFNTTGCVPTNANDQCGVHQNMSVLSYWFYQVAAGDGVTNVNGYRITGIGMDKAAAIVYKAETTYLAHNNDFAAARSAFIQASTALYGANACETITVTNAWAAVGVGAAYTYPGLTLFGNTTVCGATNYTVVTLPAIVTNIHWETTIPSNVILSCTDCNTVTITPVSTATGTLRATLSYCGGATQVLEMNISVNLPNTSALTVTRYMGSGQCVTPSVKNTFVLSNPGGSITPVEIKSDNGTLLYNQNGTSAITPATTPMFQLISSGAASLQIRLQNSCGWSAYKTFVIPSCSGSLLAVSPNPASSTITISTSQVGRQAILESGDDEAVAFTNVEISDKMGGVRRKLVYGAGTRQASIGVSDLSPGIYVVRVLRGKTWESYEVLIAR